ncbi:hypothetical protein FI667_g6097, partial [Globisporangium splendens]
MENVAAATKSAGVRTDHRGSFRWCVPMPTAEFHFVPSRSYHHLLLVRTVDASSLFSSGRSFMAVSCRVTSTCQVASSSSSKATKPLPPPTSLPHQLEMAYDKLLEAVASLEELEEVHGGTALNEEPQQHPAAKSTGKIVLQIRKLVDHQREFVSAAFWLKSVANIIGIQLRGKNDTSTSTWRRPKNTADIVCRSVRLRSAPQSPRAEMPRIAPASRRGNSRRVLPSSRSKRCGKCARSSVAVRVLVSLWSKALTLWRSLQVSRQGKYSIERLMALHDYHQRASVTRMVLVCIGTPLPALCIAILIEFVPLRPPAAGSFANWGFWIRVWITGFVMFMAATTQLKVIIPELPFTTPKCVVISIVSANVYVSAFVIAGEYIAFPIPLITMVGGVPGVVICYAAILVVLGIRPWTMDAQQRAQLLRFFNFCIIASMMLILYPAYNALFISAGAKVQSGLIFVLLGVKLVTKNVAAKTLSHLEDYLPEYVAFLVELFNALYLTSCMQNASSMHTVALTIALDLSQTIWELYRIETSVITMQKMMNRCWKRNPGMQQTDFLALAVRLCLQPHTFTRQEAQQIRLRACLDHQLSAKHRDILGSLEKLRIFGPSGRTDENSLSLLSAERTTSLNAKITSVFPIKISTEMPEASPKKTVLSGSLDRDAKESQPQPDVLAPPRSAIFSNRRRGINRPDKSDRNSELVLQALHSLFTVEYLVLVEYAECIIPDGSTTFEWSFLGNAVCYSGPEFCTLVLLNAMYWWKFRFLPLYQLAKGIRD